MLRLRTAGRLRRARSRTQQQHDEHDQDHKAELFHIVSPPSLSFDTSIHKGPEETCRFGADRI